MNRSPRTLPSHDREQRILEVLREVIDPELGVNIVDLGLVYSVEVQDGEVLIKMTMTTPACPLGSYLVDMVEAAVWRHIPEARSVQVELVWDPPWHPGMMSQAAKEQLGWSGP